MKVLTREEYAQLKILEKIKSEIFEKIQYFGQYKDDNFYDLGCYNSYNYMSNIISEHIKELKGEDNEV